MSLLAASLLTMLYDTLCVYVHTASTLCFSLQEQCILLSMVWHVQLYVVEEIVVCYELRAGGEIVVCYELRAGG